MNRPESATPAIGVAGSGNGNAGGRNQGQPSGGSDGRRKYLVAEVIIDHLPVADALLLATIDASGLRQLGAELRGRTCPTKTHSRPDAFSINRSTGQWKCHACGTAGNKLRLVGAGTGLGFRQVLELVDAHCGGILHGPVDLPSDAKRRAERFDADRRKQREAERERRERAIPVASRAWGSLRATHPRGVDYLARRLLGRAVELGVVRFFPNGDPAIALYNSKGQIWNVVRRLVEPIDDRKVIVLRGCPIAGTMGAWLGDVATARVVLIVEGFADTLAARIAYPAATVLGAHSAGTIGDVGWLVARRLAVRGLAAPDSRVPTLIARHADDAGRKGAAEAASWFGEYRIPVTVTDPRPGKDVADAWAAGNPWPMGAAA